MSQRVRRIRTSPFEPPWRAWGWGAESWQRSPYRQGWSETEMDVWHRSRGNRDTQLIPNGYAPSKRWT